MTSVLGCFYFIGRFTCCELIVKFIGGSELAYSPLVGVPLSALDDVLLCLGGYCESKLSDPLISCWLDSFLFELIGGRKGLLFSSL